MVGLSINSARFWELDFLRGTAIIMMIAFHFLFDLDYFNIYGAAGSPFWQGFARLTAAIFFFLVGACLTISYARAERKSKEKSLFWKYLKRGLTIFSFGLVVTVATFLFEREKTIVFGVLHFIGVAIILAYPFLRFRLPVLLPALLSILVGSLLASQRFNFSYLLWFGLRPAGFQTFDFFPLLPWFGVVLLGILFGRKFYPEGKRAFKFPELNHLLPTRLFCFLGRHSLLIYLLHQPVLILLVLLLSGRLEEIGFLLQP